jgi:hypothetical protein
MTTYFSFTRSIGLVLVFGALLSGCTTSPNKPSEELVKRIATARTVADHESLAAYYVGEAAKSRKSVEQYRRSDEQWRRDPRTRVTNIGRYEAVIKELDADALEYDKLAAQQRAKACEISPSAACKQRP